MSKTIGKYQIQGEIGRGGFGTVYRAWDPAMHRMVAIKVLTVQGDDDLLTRFRNEAAAAGNLHHPNIVTIHDFGEHEGTPYMVMHLLPGETLQQMIASGREMTLIQKLGIMGQVAEGLHHAHLNGIVHRDVKPPNIMVMPDEKVQIMDFGIARVTASTSRHTRTGFVIGTVRYMAPEQFLPGKVVDHRADIWAFGVIFHEFLTGRHPFAAAEEAAVLYQVAHVDPPPVTALLPDCPPALSDVIARLLMKEPELRYSSLKEFQFDMQPILLDLRREEGAQLLETARQLAGEERLEEAQAAAQRVLELDPGNRSAHQILVSVKQSLQRRLIQPKIDGLLERAEQEVQAHEYRNAIDALESALRLSHADPAIQSRLEQVKALEERARKAESLVSAAHRELRAHNLTDALRIASEAATTDPGNASAERMLAQIHRQMELREQQSRLQVQLDEAKDLLNEQRYDDALALLEPLAYAHGGDPAFSQLLAAARRQKASTDDRRNQSIARVRDAVNRLVVAGQFDSAADLLKEARTEYPNDPALLEISDSLATAADEHRKKADFRAFVARQSAAVDGAVASRNFTLAFSLIDEARREYGSDPAFDSLQQKVAQGKSASDLELARTRIRSEIDAGHLELAAGMVGTALKRFPGEVSLLNLEKEIRDATAVTSPSMPERERSRAPLYLAGALLAVGAMAAGFYALKSSTAPHTHTLETESSPTAPPRTESAPSASPSGETAPPALPDDRPAREPKTAAATPRSAKAVPAQEKPEDESPVVPVPQKPPTSVVGDSGYSPPPGATVGAGRGFAVTRQGSLGDSGPGSEAVWRGPRTGKLSWIGQLSAGDRLLVSTRGLISGPGQVTAMGQMPGWTAVEITSLRGGQLEAAPTGPGTLTITNTGAGMVTSIEVEWKTK